MNALIARQITLEPDPAEVRVVIETRHGLLVERLVDAGFTVLPVNPDLIARRRGPARKKDDAEDARLACLLALDRFTSLRALVPRGQQSAELRAIARDDVRAFRDERRLLNRLRADLLATFPAALTVAGDDDLGSPTMLRLLVRPGPARRTRDELEAFARVGRHGWPDRFVDHVTTTLTGEQFTTKPALVGAKADTIRLTAAQLLLIRDQRRVWERRMGLLFAALGRAPSVPLSYDHKVAALAAQLGASERLVDAVSAYRSL